MIIWSGHWGVPYFAKLFCNSSGVDISVIAERNIKAVEIGGDDCIHENTPCILVGGVHNVRWTGLNYRYKSAAAISPKGVVFTAINPS